jgi:3-(3-hydroxy-phenyl)propionate hydroxylase
VLNGAPDRLLDSYEAERRPHVTSMQALAVRWGGVVQTTHKSLGATRDVAIELAERTGLMAWGRERVKPRPAYKAGAFASKPHRNPFRRTVGSLFPQPDQLDEKLGHGWGVVSRSADATARWRRAGLNVVELHGDAWLTRNRCDWALLRPDRYVFACGGPDEIAGALVALRASVGSGLRTETDTQTKAVEVTA